MSRTQKQDGEGGIDQQDIFYRMVFFLAALTRGLFKRVLGVNDPPFRPVMGKSCYVESALTGEPNVTGKMRKLMCQHFPGHRISWMFKACS